MPNETRTRRSSRSRSTSKRRTSVSAPLKLRRRSAHVASEPASPGPNTQLHAFAEQHTAPIDRNSDLLPLAAVEKHLAFNVFVKQGYRPSHMSVVKSLFSWHNETANIYTHLLGALVALYFILRIDPPASSPHYWAVTVADFSCMVCLLGSVVYHAFMHASSPETYKRLLFWDMMGIWVVNTGAALNMTQLLLPCADIYVKVFVACGPSIASAIWILFLSSTPKSRALAFAIQLLARIVLTVFTSALSRTPWTPWTLFVQVLAECLSIVGSIINILRIPERWFPGSFDYFQSHTIMHVCVALGMLSQHPLGLSHAAWIDSDEQALHCVRTHHQQLLQALGLY